MKQAVAKITKLREMAPGLHISVDGGISEKNAAELIAAGANVLVVGGAVFKADDKKSAIEALKRSAQPLSSIARKVVEDH
jgi:ribulose-phosphate 3-epimerase